MSTAKVAIRIDDEGMPVVEEARVSDDLTIEPGETHELDTSEYAVKILLATQTLVIVSGEAPQPKEIPTSAEALLAD